MQEPEASNTITEEKPPISRRRILRTRTITGIIFGAFVMGSLVAGLPGILFLLFLVGVFCASEYFKMWMQYLGVGRNALLSISLMAPMAMAFLEVQAVHVLLAMVSLLVFSVNLFTRRVTRILTGTEAALWITGIFLIGLPVAFGTLLSLNVANGPVRILYLVLSIWCFDVFAYLGGTLVGRHKLAPSISPGKTIEGAIIGAIFTFALNYFFCSVDTSVTFREMVGLATIVVVFGQFGDLVESSHKRIAGIKDSGQLLPGHGGIWDRFDSLLGTLPAAYLYYTFMPL